MVKRCIRDVHCPVTGDARGHYSCLTDTIFLFVSSSYFHSTTKQNKTGSIIVNDYWGGGGGGGGGGA